jgi:hypothetical protein
MSEARAHHFISQCYLKGFTKNGSKNSKLFVFDLPQLKTFETKPEGVAHRRDFNRIEGLPAGALEAQLGRFETQADKALLKIGADRSLSDEEAWIHVLNLAALFAVRHPLQRENVRGFIERTSKMVMEIALSTPERWNAQMRQAQKSGAVPADHGVTYEQMLDFVKRDQYTVDVPNARHIALEFHVFDSVLRTLVDRKWTLCIAQPGAGHFMSSDHPVILVHSDGVSASLQRPLGHGLTGTNLFFPINRELFAVGTFEGPAGERRVGSKGIASLNGIVLAHADRQLYGVDGGRSRVLMGEQEIFAAELPEVLRRLNTGSMPI